MRFGVLGSLEVTTDDGVIPIRSGNQRTVLAALLVNAPAAVPIDRLVAALWPDAPPRSAYKTLRTYVYRLRSGLGAAGADIATEPAGYALQVEPDQIDAHHFQELVATSRDETRDDDARLRALDSALGLWRGPAYAGFADAEFARLEALRLEELFRVATEERFDRLLALERHHEVIAELETFVAQHPFRERARGQLMLALYRSGRQTDALATYRDLKRQLDREQGLEPSARLETLESDILHRSVSLEPPPRPAGYPRTSGATQRTEGAQSAAGAPAVSDGAIGTAAGPGSLPPEPTRLIGRAEDLERVQRAVAEQRAVTITGTGGVGKTRLALRVARQVTDRHPDGVWWCDLTAITTSSAVIDLLGTTLGVRPPEADDRLDAIIGYLGPRRGLVILDNAEHVTDGVRAVVERIVQDTEQVQVLVTSRSSLGIPGEHLHRLRELEVGDGSTSEHPGAAFELFLERGRAVRADLPTEGVERARMLEICRRLDGLPLAIELAASRLRALNPTDLADRLTDQLDLIRDPRRPDDRHHALRATLDWSYGLLGTVERRLFDRLSVFAGPFTLQAAEHVAGTQGIAPTEILELITRLVDHSLLAVVPDRGATRYRMLQTLRTYGRERLNDRGEDELAAERHATYHTDLARDADQQIRSRDEAIGVARLDRTLADLRAAHGWLLARKETHRALDLTTSLFRYALWRLRAEVLGWADAAARLPGATADVAFPTVAGMAGWAAGLRGDLQAATDWAERGLAAVDDATTDPRALVPLEARMHVSLWRGHLDACLADARLAAGATDDPGELVPHYVPALALTYAGRPEEALARIDQVQGLADRHASPSMRALVQYARGEARLALDPARALPAFDAAASLAAPVDNRMVLGVVDVSLMSLHARHGDPRDALVTFPPIIERLRDGGDLTHLWTGLRGLVGVLAAVGDHASAAVLLGAVRGAPGSPPAYGEDAQRLDDLEEGLRGRLGQDRLEAALAEGRGLTDPEAFDLAQRTIAAATATTTR